MSSLDAKFLDLEKGNPTKEDRLFSEKNGFNLDYSSIHDSTGINNHHTEFLIIEGYREAAKELLNNLLMDNDINWLKLDSKIFPIMFLIRHYIESILKSCLRYYRILYDEVYYDEIGYKRDHSVKVLWQSLNPYLEKSYEFIDDRLENEYLETDSAVTAIIDEIDRIDQNSFSFRYSFEGAKSINENVRYSIKEKRHIDIQNLNDVFTKLINYFEGIYDGVIYMLNEKQSNFDTE